MKVKSTLITLFLLTFSFVLIAQEAVQFTPKDLQNISKRWSKYHPRAEVFLENGDTLIGQPISFNMQELLIFPSDSLPVNLEGLLVSIPFDDIDRIDLNRGGPITPGLTTGIIIGVSAGIGIGLAVGSPGAAIILGNVFGVGGGFAGKAIQRASTSAELELDPQNLKYPQELIKLHEWSVFKDTLIYTNDINQLPAHSRAMRRLYPQKHFRITLGMNWGLNSLEKDMRKAIEASGLHPWLYYNHYAMGFEYLDFSWRFNHHWIIGGGFLTNYYNLADASYNDYNSVNPEYNYSVDMTDYRIYMEYAFSPVNRFLTDRTELLVGGGVIISRPSAYFSYYDTDPNTGSYDNYGNYGPNTLFGFQARAAYHLYLFRNFSFSGGMELNLYQNMNMPAAELSTGETVLEAHSLNYSTVRFKLGAHLYF